VRARGRREEAGQRHEVGPAQRAGRLEGRDPEEPPQAEDPDRRRGGVEEEELEAPEREEADLDVAPAAADVGEQLGVPVSRTTPAPASAGKSRIEYAESPNSFRMSQA
jgi:hypothetical protein